VSHTPEHAIQECLADLELNGPQDARLLFRMRPEALHFVKNREVSGHQLWYVTCEVASGQKGTARWHWTVLVTQEQPGRWSAQCVAGGSGESPLFGYPWANLGGHWGPDGFRAGGTVEDAGRGVARVTLTDVDGRTFEDTVDNGVVLFFSDEPVTMPMRVRLFDPAGRVVTSEEWGFTDE
jgi:hypothetical protein